MKSISLILVLSITVVISLMIFSGAKNIAYSHTFSGDESASFLTLIEEISTGSQLIEKLLPSNSTLAQEIAVHMSHLVPPETFEEISEKNKFEANSLNESLSDIENSFNFTNKIVPSNIKEKLKNLDDILGEVVSVRIQNEQLANNTVKALVLNDLVGKGLESYGEALGIKEEHSEEQKAEHVEEKDGHETEDHGQISLSSFPHSFVNIALIDSAKSQDASNKNINNAEIVDQVEYQIAQALFNKSIEKFNELKPSINSNMSNMSSILESSLVKLKNAVDNKEPFDTIDDIVDDEVTPQLESIFKIKLAEEE
ncbi:MAG TPA: hypothetical protein VFK40_09115 [Nitrososphaeraceae archaeon]|nr:hypothetical protein [Nitrososphaeraceae archaeon]